MLTERDDRLIQRAVDGELSADDRCELTQRMRCHPDSWQQLACAFLEDQLLQRAVVGAASKHTADVSHQALPLPGRTKQTNAFWLRHPGLSVAVTMLMTFLLGLLVPWGRTAEESPGDDVVQSDGSGETSGVVRMTSDSAGPPSVVSVQLVQDGAAGAGIELPVYEDIGEFSTALQSHLGTLDSGFDEFPDGFRPSRIGSVQVFRIQLPDGRQIVLPMQNILMTPEMQ